MLNISKETKKKYVCNQIGFERFELKTQIIDRLEMITEVLNPKLIFKHIYFSI